MNDENYKQTTGDLIEDLIRQECFRMGLTSEKFVRGENRININIHIKRKAGDADIYQIDTELILEWISEAIQTILKQEMSNGYNPYNPNINRNPFMYNNTSNHCNSFNPYGAPIPPPITPISPMFNARPMVDPTACADPYLHIFKEYISKQNNDPCDIYKFIKEHKLTFSDISKLPDAERTVIITNFIRFLVFDNTDNSIWDKFIDVAIKQGESVNKSNTPFTNPYKLFRKQPDTDEPMTDDTDNEQKTDRTRNAKTL